MRRLAGKFAFAVVALCIVAASTTPLLAEVRQISYQGRITTAGGTPIPDGYHTVRFDLYASRVGGTSLWHEGVAVVTTDGLFSHELGWITPLTDNVLGLDSVFLEIKIEGEIQSPRTQLFPALRAMRVNTVNGANGGTVVGSLYLYDTLSHGTYAAIQRYSSTGDAEFSLNGTARYVWLDMGSPYTKSVRLPIGAIDATEMQNEPGVGSYVNETGFVVSTGVNYLAGRTMNAPSDGYVLVIATAEVWVSHTYGSNDNFFFGLSDDMSSLPTSTKTGLRIGSTLPSDTYTRPVTLHALFPIDSGSQAFYFLGQQISGTCHVENIMMTEVFVPTAYTTINTPMPRIGDAAELTATDDPGLERQAAEAFNQRRVEGELAAMKAELEVLKQRLNALDPPPPEGQ